MASVQAIYQDASFDASRYLFFRESIWTRYLGLEPSPITLGLCFVSGILILALCIECTVSIEANSRNRNLILALRTALAILASVAYLDALCVNHITGNRHIESAIPTIAIYGLLKVYDICVVPLINGSCSPEWIGMPPKQKTVSNGASAAARDHKNVASMKKKSHNVYKKARLGYSLDLITTLRGVSWLGDRHFDFLSPRVVSEQMTMPSRMPFICYRLAHLLMVCICYDICDSITKSQTWLKAQDLRQVLPDGTITFTSPDSPTFTHQITTRPLYQQAIFVLIVAATTQLSLETFYTTFAIICVGVFGVNPKAFPHFFGSPISLHTDSVRAFWGARWHHIFRRVFARAIDPWLHIFRISKRSALGITLKVIAVFSLSGLIHCIIQARSLVYYFPLELTTRLLDLNTLWFFLSQPFALFFEHLVIRPALRYLPPPLAYIMRRVWTWGWLFWSARWWADTWVMMGMWQPNEQVVFFSPVRGLWKGEWIVQTV